MEQAKSMPIPRKPGARGLPLPGRRVDADAAAEADDEVEAEVLLQLVVEGHVSEAAVRQHDDLLDAARQQPLELPQELVLVRVAAFGQLLRRHRLPDQGRRPPMPRHEIERDPMLRPICVVRPVERYDQPRSRANDERHVAHEGEVPVERRVAQESVELLDGVLGRDATGCGHGPPDVRDARLGRVRYAHHRMRKRENLLGVEARFGENAFDCALDSSCVHVRGDGEGLVGADYSPSLPLLPRTADWECFACQIHESSRSLMLEGIPQPAVGIQGRVEVSGALR